MAIAFDASSSTSGALDLSWTHTPVGTPRGVLVLVVQDASTIDRVDGVTYGGTAMTEVPLSPLLHATGSEDAVIYGYFLGASVPTGAQTVVVDTTTSNARVAWAVTVTAAADTAVDDTSILDSGGTGNPSTTLQTTASVETFIAAVLHSGHDSVASHGPSGDYTEVGTHDFGAATVSFVCRTANGTGGDIAVQWAAASEEAGILAVAIAEASATQEISPALLTATATLFSPTVVNTQLVSPDVITQTATLYAPTVAPDQDVTPGLLTSAATLYAPLVANEQDVSPGIISLTSQIFAPLIVPDQDVSPALLTATATLYAPTVFVFDIGSATGSTATAQSAIGTDSPQSTSVGSTGTAQGAVGSEAGQTSAKGSSAAAYPGKATIHP